MAEEVVVQMGYTRETVNEVKQKKVHLEVKEE